MRPGPGQLHSGRFHRFIGRRAHLIGGLNATSTHDSKRNEDARCRLAVLSEASDQWARLVGRWHRRFGSVPRAPEPHDELVVYQTLVSLWPANRAGPPGQHVRRVQDYTLKAAREAKLYTSWTEPDPRYERDLRTFVARICHEQRFRTEMSRFVRAIAPAAASISLALTVLKACTPGTPDFFQGTELFEATLTDPDNRRPVDFSAREALLASLPDMTTGEANLLPRIRRMLADWETGQIKLHVIRSLLHLRRALPAAFANNSYIPLNVSGPRASNVVACSRRAGPQWLIAMVPRLTFEAAGRGRFPTGRRVWGGTTCRLPKDAPESYVDIFTGRAVVANAGCLDVASALGVLPVAALRVADEA